MRELIRRMERAVSRRLRSRETARIAAAAVLIGGGAVSLAYAPGPSVVKVMSGASARPNPLDGAKLYVDPNSDAWRQAHAWREVRPADAAHMERIAAQPAAAWIGDWGGSVRDVVSRRVRQITSAGALPVLVAYNIPHRDCGSYSRGGSKTAAAYRKWIREFASGLAGREAVIILEPDALPAMKCLPAAGQKERLELIRDAVGVLKAEGAAVYIDAGHSGWLRPEKVAPLLASAGIANADGFSLNVSNFRGTAENIAYGAKVSKLVGGKHMIIDTSRNGKGSNGEWCNPRGRALGETPTVRTRHSLVDAFLWIKLPGQSDGTCGGGPSAGKWWADYALELARGASRQVAAAEAG